MQTLPIPSWSKNFLAGGCGATIMYAIQKIFFIIIYLIVYHCYQVNHDLKCTYVR